MLNHAQEKIVSILKERMVDADVLAKELGREYTENKVKSMVLTLARKGYVDKVKAALILRGTKMIDLLQKDFGSKMIGKIPSAPER